MDAARRRRPVWLVDRAYSTERGLHDRGIPVDRHNLAAAELWWYQYDIYRRRAWHGLSGFALHDALVKQKKGCLCES